MKFLNRIDQHYLQKVLAIQSHSGTTGDENIKRFILDELKKLNVKVQVDNYGNIYVTKGEAKNYPCLAAHIDTVHPILNEITLYRDGDTLFAFNPTTKHQTGIGGDDKVGVYILLQALKDIETVKAVFFRNEEIGTLGSNYSIDNHKTWYDDCGFIIQADRRGDTDFIDNMNGASVCSDDFYNACKDHITKYGYKKHNGITTDVYTLARKGLGISVANISCGYYAPHTNYETVSIQNVNRAYNLVYDIVTKIKRKKYTHEYKTYFNSFNKNTKYKSTFGSPLSREYYKQEKLFSPLVVNSESDVRIDISDFATRKEYKDFVFDHKTTYGTKIFKYIGINDIPLINAPACPVCNKKDCLTFLPYEGKLYCIEHNNYVPTEDVQPLIRYIETEDDRVTFVYSVYMNGWVYKHSAIWHAKLESWVPDNLPF